MAQEHTVDELQARVSELTISGTDRNEVILDGEFDRDHGIVVEADGVALENMTARHYWTNVFYWPDGENVCWEQTGLQVWNQSGDTIRVFNPDGDLVVEHTYGDQTSSIRGIFGTVRALFAQDVLFFSVRTVGYKLAVTSR